MHSETNERLQIIRSEVAGGKTSISDLKTRLADNADRYINHVLQQGSNSFDDVELLFLGILKEERTPPRSLSEESRVLDHAEFLLERIAIPQLKAIQDMVAKFGPNL